jgi:hypothetical protein
MAEAQKEISPNLVALFPAIVSKVKCTNGSCSPAVAGPSNACMYICGQLTCSNNAG